MEILANGFLDDKMHNKINAVKKEYNEEIDLLSDFNKLAYKIIAQYHKIEPVNENLYLLPAFIEINKLYQAAVIMLEYGFVNCFESTMRNMFELSFQMIYVINDSNNMKNLEKFTYSEVIKKMKYIKDNKLYDIVPEESVEEICVNAQKLKDELKGSGAKNPPNIKDMCNNLGLQKEYAYYQYLSDYTHNDYSIIFGSNKFQEDGVYLDTNGDYSNFRNNSLRLISVLDMTLTKMIDKYAKVFKEEYDALIDKAHLLYNKE